MMCCCTLGIFANFCTEKVKHYFIQYGYTFNKFKAFFQELDYWLHGFPCQAAISLLVREKKRKHFSESALNLDVFSRTHGLIGRSLMKSIKTAHSAVTLT